MGVRDSFLRMEEGSDRKEGELAKEESDRTINSLGGWIALPPFSSRLM